MEGVTNGALEASKTAVTLAIGLIGMMALWLGMMRLAEKAGLVTKLARLVRPIMTRLFPDVPPEHPAMGSMLMNIAANMLGLANSATPLGLRAMKDLEKLNPHPGTATNAMCTFLAINTSSVQLLPATVIAILVSAGSQNPTAIVSTALMATICSTLAAIVAIKLLQNLRWFALPASTTAPVLDFSEKTVIPAEEINENSAAPIPVWGMFVLVLFFLSFAWFFLSFTWKFSDQGTTSVVRSGMEALSLLAIPFLLSFFPLVASLRRIPVYEEFTEGAKEGFDVAVRIIPFLIAILVAIGMFRGAGGIEILTKLLAPALSVVGFSPELLPLVIMRPLSGSGTMGIFSELVTTFGPDSLIARTAATIFGSTETTFYVVTVYFGAVAIRRTRHAIAAGLIADLAGIIASVAICNFMFK